MYDAIRKQRIDSKTSGFYDVFAWQGDDFIFIEYKGPRDKPNKNEAPWVDAALDSGINEKQLIRVIYD